MAASNVRPDRVPRSTYRLQFNAGFRLTDATALVDYDVIDPEIGTETDFRTFAAARHRRGLGLMMDVVPNHMGIDDWHNAWWQDVLANGPSSRWAAYFDIDWSPPKASLQDRILLPFLGDQFGRVLENQELKLVYDDGRFYVTYYDRQFPLAICTTLPMQREVLARVRPELADENPHRMELESIMTAVENLPPRSTRDPQQIHERRREIEVLRRRLATLTSTSVPIHRAMGVVVDDFNGRRGDWHSFDRLEELLANQSYRLCYWRVASDEINYRRFFDINGLAAIRVEDPEVFQAVHAMVVRFHRQGWVDALRIDHPDGLLDPRQYFQDLQAALAASPGLPVAGGEGQEVPVAEQGHSQNVESEQNSSGDGDSGNPVYIVAEKILMRDEELPGDWPICGTTGYDFLNLVNGLFIDRRGAGKLSRIYGNFTGQSPPFRDIVYHAKRTILSTSMASELYVLAGQLERISERHRWWRDFTRSTLHRALTETIACFPVYRTYIHPAVREVREEDRLAIQTAIHIARWRNPALSPAIFDFLAAVLLLEYPQGLGDDDRLSWEQFVLKFQQVTGPVMAKGYEDTAFYRWYPLASLNEVGGDPAATGLSADRFHARMQQQAARWPLSMLATATHDTKRGEDVRTRLDVLSESPEAWEEAVFRWQSLNEGHRSEIEGSPVPDANEEYLLYQTLVGAWPLPQDKAASEEFVERIVAYMAKAMKEAKIHTSWANPNESHEKAVEGFARAVLDEGRSGQFLRDLSVLAGSIAAAGWINSLSQCLLKIAAPGVPDFYQGCELWDFHLVDPDNRRAVDFDHRKRLLAELQARAAVDLPSLAADVLSRWPDERLKMFVTWRALSFRREEPALFLEGQYLPLSAHGPRSDNICGFARQSGDHWAIAVAPRLIYEAASPDLAAWFEGTWLDLPSGAPQHWRNVFTGRDFAAEESGPGKHLDLARLFAQFPIALLRVR